MTDCIMSASSAIINHDDKSMAQYTVVSEVLVV